MPKLLDLFSGAGGAGEGYRIAGFDVVGVDIIDQPDNPHTFIQGDVFKVARDLIDSGEFDAIHASPPCQAYSSTKTMKTAGKHLALIEPTRELLQASGLPYVIENVVGSPLMEPTVLCGSMFGLGANELILRRHRLFETSFVVDPLTDACRGKRAGGVYGHLSRNARSHFGGAIKMNLTEAEESMGITWMKEKQLVQAIPPAYTQYIGKYLLQEIG